MAERAVSIIIASVNGLACLDACLAPLTRQQSIDQTEIIVIDADQESISTYVTQHYPQVVSIQTDPPANLGRMRFAGIEAAQGQIIALTEDHCLAPEGWIAEMLSAHSRINHAAIGGRVLNKATDRYIDKSVFLYEYGTFSDRSTPGSVLMLAAANVSYKRESLQAIWDELRGEFWELKVNSLLRTNGDDLWFDPALSIHHRKHDTLRSYLHERYHFSKWYAGQRARERGWLFGLLFLPAGVLVTLYRAVKLVFSGPVTRLIYLPTHLLFALVSAAGEFAGTVFGPGTSSDQLR